MNLSSEAIPKRGNFRVEDHPAAIKESLQNRSLPALFCWAGTPSTGDEAQGSQKLQVVSQ
jgi:hypothetical protein